MQTFYYRDQEGREIGPFDLTTLVKLRGAGVLHSHTTVRAAESTEWKRLEEIAAGSPAPASVPQSAGKALLGIGVIAVLALAFLIYHGPNHQAATRLKVINALRQIEGAKETWALENKKGLSAVPTENDLLQYLNLKGGFPKHPSGGKYLINAVKDESESTVYGTMSNMARSAPTNSIDSLVVSEYWTYRSNALYTIRKLFGD